MEGRIERIGLFHPINEHSMYLKHQIIILATCKSTFHWIQMLTNLLRVRLKQLFTQKYIFCVKSSPSGYPRCTVDVWEISHYIICSPMDPLQWMGAIRMIAQTTDKNITIISRSSINILRNKKLHVYDKLFTSQDIKWRTEVMWIIGEQVL